MRMSLRKLLENYKIHVLCYSSSADVLPERFDVSTNFHHLFGQLL